MRKEIINIKNNQVKFLELKNTLCGIHSRLETTKEKILDWEKIFAMPLKGLVPKVCKGLLK